MDLFNRLETKNKFYNNKFTQNNLILPTISNKKIEGLGYNYTNIYTNSNINNTNISRVYTEERFDESEIKNAAASRLFTIPNKSRNLIDNDSTIINIKKLKTKLNIINSNANQTKKKEKILGVDLFQYNKNKWEKKNLREVNN
jgi:hypothetical protein